tara:strand:- start:6398 stop:6730 length:333 start_codon:yes stop_codon:yes gene_type:complete
MADKKKRRALEDAAIEERKKRKQVRVHNFKTDKPGQFLPKDQTMKIRVPGKTLTVQKNFRDLSPTNPHRIYPDADFGEKQSGKRIENRIKAGRSPFPKSAAQRFKDRYTK